MESSGSVPQITQSSYAMSGLTSASQQQIMKETFEKCMKESMTHLLHSFKQEHRVEQEKFGKELSQRLLDEFVAHMRSAQKSATKGLYNAVNNTITASNHKMDDEDEEDLPLDDLSFSHKLLLGNTTLNLLDFHELNSMVGSTKEKHATDMGYILLSAQLYNLTDNDSVVVRCPLADELSVPNVDTILSRIKETAGDDNGGGPLLLVIPSDSDSYYQSDYFLLLKRDRAFQIVYFQPMEDKAELLFNVVRATVMYFKQLKNPLPLETINDWKRCCHVTTLSGKEGLNDLGNILMMSLNEYPSEVEWVNETVKEVSPYFDGKTPDLNDQTRFYALATAVMALVLENETYECWLKNKAACENFQLFLKGSKYAELQSNMQAVIYFATFRLLFGACKIVRKDFIVTTLTRLGFTKYKLKNYVIMEDAMVNDCNKNLIAALSSVFDDNKDVEGVVTASLHCFIKVCVISHSLYFPAQEFFDSKTKENKFLCPSSSAISSDPKSRKLHTHYLKMLGTSEDTLEDETIEDGDKEESVDDASKSASAAFPNSSKKSIKKVPAKRKQTAVKGSSGKKPNTNAKKL